MRAIFVTWIILAPAALGKECPDNHCARAITDTAIQTPSIETRRADCANFMTTTVYATPTATTTVYGPPGQFLRKRNAVTAPRPPVPAYATACPLEKFYSSACSCWGFTAATITVGTPTTTVAATVSPTCHRGFQYAYYSATKGDGFGQIPLNPGNGVYSEFVPKITEIKSWTPTQTGVTYKLGGFTNNNDASKPVVIYDVVGSGRSDYFAIDHRGYLYTQQAGTYTFTFINTGEITIAFVPPNVHTQLWYHGPISVTATFAQGEYVPLRILHANAQGGGWFHMKITAPDNTVIMDENTSANDYILQYCDQGPAVPYAPWGQW